MIAIKNLAETRQRDLPGPRFRHHHLPQQIRFQARNLRFRQQRMHGHVRYQRDGLAAVFRKHIDVDGALVRADGYTQAAAHARGGFGQRLSAQRFGAFLQ